MIIWVELLLFLSFIHIFRLKPFHNKLVLSSLFILVLRGCSAFNFGAQEMAGQRIIRVNHEFCFGKGWKILFYNTNAKVVNFGLGF